jgi:hypothetical protein
MFLLSQLPVAFFCGLNLEQVNEHKASISVKYRWFNRNPFRSMYFAVLSMAGEVSTGILAMGYLYKRSPSVSMLLVKTEGQFFKKATGKIVFTCEDGSKLKEKIDEALHTGEPTSCQCKTVGMNAGGELVASFTFTWSFKKRHSNNR